MLRLGHGFTCLYSRHKNDNLKTSCSDTANMPQSASEDEWPSLANLPANTAWEIGSTSTAIRRVVNREQAKELTTAAPYIVFSNVPLLLIDESNERPSIVGGKNVRIFYNQETHYLILKLVSGPHEVAERMLSRKIDQAVEHMGLEDELLPMGSKLITLTSHSKEPDSSWRPRSLPVGRTDQWPTVVIETGFIESISRLRLDSQWWITSSRGDVKVVIIMAIHPSNPQFILEKWAQDQTVGPARGTRDQITVIREPDNVVTTTGAPLTIAFEELFLRQANPQESDIVIPVEALERIAYVTWMEQGI